MISQSLTSWTPKKSLRPESFSSEAYIYSRYKWFSSLNQRMHSHVDHFFMLVSRAGVPCPPWTPLRISNFPLFSYIKKNPHMPRGSTLVTLRAHYYIFILYFSFSILTVHWASSIVLVAPALHHSNVLFCQERAEHPYLPSAHHERAPGLSRLDLLWLLIPLHAESSSALVCWLFSRLFLKLFKCTCLLTVTIHDDGWKAGAAMFKS